MRRSRFKRSIALRPVFPMLPGTPARASHDYVRHGTSSLYAALDLSTGKVIGALHTRHRATEFLAFLKTIDASVPTDLDVHLVLDNASNPQDAGSPALAAGAPAVRPALHT
jgi:DDE superfamily endonuclease